MFGSHGHPGDEERQELQGARDGELVAHGEGPRGDGNGHGDGDGGLDDLPERCGQAPQEQGEQEPGDPGRDEGVDRGVGVQGPVGEQVQEGAPDQVGDEYAGEQAAELAGLRGEAAGEVAGDEDEHRHVERVDQQVRGVDEAVSRVLDQGFPEVAADDEDQGEDLRVVEERVPGRGRAS